MNKIYVANIPFSSSATEIEKMFAECGTIKNVNLITDRETGRLRGFGFVEFEDKGAVDLALKLNGKEVNGRALTVRIAEDRRTGGGGGNGGRGGRPGGGERRHFSDRGDR